MLGCCLLGGDETIAKLAGMLVPGDFHRPQHGALFARLLDMRSEGKAIDIVSVMADAGDRSTFDDYGGAGYLAGHPATVGSIEMVEGYAEAVKAGAARRSTLLTLQSALESLKAGGDVSAVAAAAVRALTGVSDVAAVGWQTMPDLVRVTADEMLSRDPHQMGGIPTGIHDLDQHLWGLRLGKTSIWAGRPGMGKSAIVGVVARNASSAGVPVGIVSLEMRAGEWVERMAVAAAGLDTMSATRGRLDDDERWRLLRAMEDLSDLPIYVDDRGGQTVTGIARGVRRLVRERGARLVIVDYLQLVAAEDARVQLNQAVTQISAALTALAKELDVHVMIACQLNRGPEDRTNHRPTTRDLRDSGSIEQDASLIVFPYREEVYAPDDVDARGVMELIVVKHRYGPCGTIRVACDLSRMRITDLARNDYHDRY